MNITVPNSEANDEERQTSRLPVVSLEWVRARLLNGPIYDSGEDAVAFEVVTRYRKPLYSFFQELGLILLVNENYGIALLRQAEDDELEELAKEIYEDGGSASPTPLPPIFRKNAMNRIVSVTFAVLNQEFLRASVDNVREVIIDAEYLYQTLKNYLSAEELRDEVKARNKISSNLRAIERQGFISHTILDGKPAWKIMPIIDMVISKQSLDGFKNQMIEYLVERKEYVSSKLEEKV